MLQINTEKDKNLYKSVESVFNYHQVMNCSGWKLPFQIAVSNAIGCMCSLYLAFWSFFYVLSESQQVVIGVE